MHIASPSSITSFLPKSHFFLTPTSPSTSLSCQLAAIFLFLSSSFLHPIKGMAFLLLRLCYLKNSTQLMKVCQINYQLTNQFINSKKKKKLFIINSSSSSLSKTLSSTLHLLPWTWTNCTFKRKGKKEQWKMLGHLISKLKNQL